MDISVTTFFLNNAIVTVTYERYPVRRMGIFVNNNNNTYYYASIQTTLTGFSDLTVTVPKG